MISGALFLFGCGLILCYLSAIIFTPKRELVGKEDWIALVVVFIAVAISKYLGF